MATTSQAPLPTPKEFTINLKILENGDIDATGDYQTGMHRDRCDTARFVVVDSQGREATNVLSVLIEFRGTPTQDLEDEPVSADVFPFGMQSIGNPKTALPLVNACSGFMLVTVITNDGRSHHCAWDSATNVQGSSYCTQPVKCPH